MLLIVFTVFIELSEFQTPCLFLNKLQGNLKGFNGP